MTLAWFGLLAVIPIVVWIAVDKMISALTIGKGN